MLQANRAGAERLLCCSFLPGKALPRLSSQKIMGLCDRIRTQSPWDADDGKAAMDACVLLERGELFVRGPERGVPVRAARGRNPGDGIHGGADGALRSEIAECSRLEGVGGLDRSYSPEQVALALAQATGLTIAAARPQNLDERCFWRATLFDASKVSHLQSFCKFPIAPRIGGRTNQERGVMVLFSQFRVLGAKPGGRQTFWVLNLHFPQETDLKLAAICWLNAHAASTCEKKNACDAAFPPLIFAGGDLNTYFDRDGQELLNALAARWTRLSSAVEFTFRHLPFESHKQRMSLLDHIFVHQAASAGKDFRVGEAKVCKDELYVSPSGVRSCASDHFPLHLDFELE
eukprot:c12306_g1_i1.p1 GENE.c12306_g1_i1~~c12306_g1_i1.p1  ORF type:complete len:347 (+),score=57.76 c12306_g1_i1:474-1514(+)